MINFTFWIFWNFLAQFGKYEYFITLDLAFHQIDSDPIDIKKTTFSFENGHFEFFRMPLFKKRPFYIPTCNEQHSDRNIKWALSYLLVYRLYHFLSSNSTWSYFSINRSFERLGSADLKIQLNKCEFLHKQDVYFGHVITSECAETKSFKNWKH